MTEPIFSEREGFVPRIELQAEDYLQRWVRESITNEIRRLAQQYPQLGMYVLFRPYIARLVGNPPGNPMGGPFSYYIPETISRCPWFELYDILEQVSELIKQQTEDDALQTFSNKINAILARDGIPWTLHQCKVVRRFKPEVATLIKEVSTLLIDPKFKGPDAQFAKAVEHLNRRPTPDRENCVKDAVGAVEAVANIIARTSGKQLNDLLKEEPFKSSIHTTIIQAIEKVYAYRGAAPGASHGQVGPAAVGIEEAMWVIAISAATILYFVSKFHKTT